MSKDYKVPFAFDSNGNCYDITSAKKGVSYICNCGSELRLRGGDIISNHFYHVDGSYCSNESAIHKAYKYVLLKEKRIKLPFEINGKKELVFDKVDLEKKIGDFIPDAIGYIENEMYLIEFAKTSFIKEIKAKKIEEANLFCLEVNISAQSHLINQIKDHIVNQCFYKHVLYIPHYKKIDEIHKFYEAQISRLKLENNNLEKENERLSSVIRHLRQIDVIKKTEDLEDENYTLRDKLSNLNKYESIIDAIEGKGLYIEYKKECSNGAKFFASKNGLIAFVSDKYISLKSKINE